MIVLNNTPGASGLAPATCTPWVVVVLAGELDFAASHALDVLDVAVKAHPGAHILVDLSDVTFLDHTALFAFALAKSRAEAQGGVLSLHGASVFALKLLEIWHLEPASSEPPVGGDAA
ncbi:STAS domain-containing protein [Nocardioides sp. zg-1308]|uniref:STAS domain-containing protein n=1 Tax=Nocardioides sp. zg-1308 TaxID=2736253 RepID=UPI0015534FF3|nr:STAS domain-containing protein [Nocardioides sp. zg-1308]NPD06416.1 STAS domain-containing protein [Nocardioides sp. zg-1308]